MYRAVTFIAMHRGVDLGDISAVGELARNVSLDVGENGVLVGGLDATVEIRSSEINAAVSVVAANSEVRAEMRARQRRWAEQRGGGVIEGRDIGSVVFPEAILKLYLTASPRVRAERRVAEAGGDIGEVERSIALRDERDSTRADSPLREADGSIVLDTSGRSVDEILATIEELLKGAG